jgi:cell division protein YceG involved in septum cleavage
MNESELQNILKSLCETDAQAIQRFFGKNTNLQNAITTIDPGDYEWSEWFKAMAVLQLWLESKKQDYPLERKLGYLSCTVDAFKTTPTVMRPKLSEATERMLAQYGFSDQ